MPTNSSSIVEVRGMSQRQKAVLLAVIVGTLVFGPFVTRAAGLVVPCDTQVVDGKFVDPCGVDSFVEQFIVLTQYGIGLVSVLAVLMFVYGGFQFLTAAGRASKVDEGKRVILGTIVGLMISFSAFVIVNFTVAAVTGSPLARSNLNPFGAIAEVFSGQKGLNRPFNSTGQTTDTGKCHSQTSGWDTNCTDLMQIHCADSSATAGSIRDLQLKLNGLSCGQTSSLQVDGCFGPLTMSAVQRFQVANDLLPTGMVDQTTQNKLAAGTKTCSADPALVDGVTKLLPSPQDSTQDHQQLGCCVVKNSDGQPLFCGDQVTYRACDASGGQSQFYPDVTSCATDSFTRDTCGYCQDTRFNTCFQTTSAYWCTTNVRDATDPVFRMTFVAGRTAPGEKACENGWTNSLLNLPP